MDDCLASADVWKKDENIKELLMNGRHYKISFILTMQYAIGIPPALRSNFDYIIMFAEDNILNRKKLYDNYCGVLNYKLFGKVFNGLTKNFGCMIMNNRGARENINQKVFGYRAEYTPDEFKGYIGSKKYIKYHMKKYDKNWSDVSKKQNNDEIT